MRKFFLYFFSGVAITSCHSKTGTITEDPAVPEVVTPVTVVTIAHGPMEEVALFNATSVFRQKWIIRSNLTGYLQTANVSLNKFVHGGEVLFTLQTKEAQSIGNTINRLDPSFNFSGTNTVHANGTGFISEINRHTGDYVQEGEQLAVITDTKSFVFLLDLPYEMHSYIAGTRSLTLILPGGEKLPATVNGSIPVMDSVSQTQQFILKVNTAKLVPENLIAKVQIVKRTNAAASYLPKAAVLSDETQSDFWVMKLINDSTAAKVPIQKGIETTENIEVVSPVFSNQDRILVTGNFAMADTAIVKVLTAPSK